MAASTYDLVSALMAYIEKNTTVRKVDFGSVEPTATSMPSCTIVPGDGALGQLAAGVADDEMAVIITAHIAKDPEDMRTVLDVKDSLITKLMKFDPHRGHRVYEQYQIKETTNRWEVTLTMILKNTLTA